MPRLTTEVRQVHEKQQQRVEISKIKHRSPIIDLNRRGNEEVNLQSTEQTALNWHCSDF